MKRGIINWSVAITLAFLIALPIRMFFFESYTNTSKTLQNTILDGESILISKNCTLKRNQIIAFHHPLDNNSSIRDKRICIKRCVGLPGDTLQIANKSLFINLKEIKPTGEQSFDYRVFLFDSVERAAFAKRSKTGKIESSIGLNTISLSIDDYRKIKSDSVFRFIQTICLPNGFNNPKIFPYSYLFRWNKDHFGPLIIPRKNSVIRLTPENLAFYKQIVTVYEQNHLEVKNNEIYINQEKTQLYKIQQNYFFVINDVRDNPEDSRTWGFIPENHIIGAAKIIWFSVDENNQFRWSRLCKLI